MKIRLRLLLALAAASLATGCGLMSGGSGNAAPLPDPATSATVVLYHVRLGSAQDEDFTNHNAYLDGAYVGRLNEGEELRLKTTPGVHQLDIRPEMKLIGSARQDPMKYSLQLAPGSTRYLRYRTAIGPARIDAGTGLVYADRSLGPVNEEDYANRR